MEEEARKMSSSNSIRKHSRDNVIKINSPVRKLEIIDYRQVIEEISADAGFVPEDLVTGPQEIAPDITDAAGARGTDAAVADESKSALTIAFEKGFEAGKNESAKLFQQEYDRKVQETVSGLTSVIREFAEEVRRYEQDFDKAVVTLALAVARRIVAHDIDIEGAVLTRVRESLKRIIGVEKVKIHVCPADEEYVRKHKNDLSTYADSVREIAVEPDEKVERGGCIIESELGNIDARLSTQFDLVEEALFGLVKR